MIIDLNDKRYTIEFRHLSSIGKRAQIHRAPLKAVTTCVIIVQFIPVQDTSAIGKIHLVAIDNALCAMSDNYSRRHGRAEALRKALERCGAFDDDTRLALWSRYHGIEKCPTCAGEGWMMKSEGEPCGDRLNPIMNGGTGWKGGQILWLDHRLLHPIRVQPPRPVKIKPTAAEIAAWKEEGAEKRRQRQFAARHEDGNSVDHRGGLGRRGLRGGRPGLLHAGADAGRD